MATEPKAPPSKKQKLMETAVTDNETLVIDPQGDLMVHLQDTTVQISSYILSLASPVFKAMLSGNFIEGQEGTARKDARYEACLSEDDSASFVLLCKILHHQPSTAPKLPDPPALLELAKICDKYQCVDALAIHFDKWTTDNLNAPQGTSSPDQISKLLLVSYIADMPNQFKLISEGILEVFRTKAMTPQQRKSWYDVMSDPIVRHDLPFKFEFKRRAIDTRIKDGFMMLPFTLIEKCICNDAKKYAGTFMESLNEADLLPAKIAVTSVKDLTQKALAFPRTTHRYSSCQFHKTSMGDEMYAMVYSIAQAGLGLCLDCIKSEGNPGIEKKCRISHETINVGFGQGWGVYKTN